MANEQKKRIVPIKIGVANFTVDMSKKNAVKIACRAGKQKQELEKWLADFEKSDQNEEEQLELLNKKLGNFFDSLLGSGAYDENYEQSPSVIENLNIYTAVCTSLTAKAEEYNRR